MTIQPANLLKAAFKAGLKSRLYRASSILKMQDAKRKSANINLRIPVPPPVIKHLR